MAENMEAFHILSVEPNQISFIITSTDQLSSVLMEASISYAHIKECPK